MKDNLSKYVKEVITGFQSYRGRASVYCFPPIRYGALVCKLIKEYYIKHDGVQIFIVVDSYPTRLAILKEINADKTTTYNVKCLSADYVKKIYNYPYQLIITVGVNDDLDLLKFLSTEGKFMLSVFTKTSMNNEFASQIRKILPNIDVTVSNAAVRNDDIYSPVEEYRIACGLSDDGKLLYDKCSEYISTSVSIFGDLAIIDKCKLGDPDNNISGAEYRETVAMNNGWSPTLDTTIGWNKQIDDIYNPNVLLERANTFYNITKERRELVMNNPNKIEHILKICLDNRGKKIVIVSKHGSFASNITTYINSVFANDEDIKCADYHDTIEEALLVDDNNQPVLVKSGPKKGEPKVIGAQAISTINMKRFNAGNVNILSIKGSSNAALDIDVDIVLFTTSFVDNIIAFKTRFSAIKFNAVPTIIYKVYTNGTIEHKKLLNQKESTLITVIEDDSIIGYDESNNDVYI